MNAIGDLTLHGVKQSVNFNAKDATDLKLSKWGIAADPRTLATNLPGVFAGGERGGRADRAAGSLAGVWRRE